MPNKIVNLIVSQTAAPAPSTLQRTSVIVSQGGTNLAAGSRALLTMPSDFTSVSDVAATFSFSWAAGVAMVTVSGPPTFFQSGTFPYTISGVTPSGYNGTFQVSASSPLVGTFPLVANPGAVTQQGVIVEGEQPELLSAITTFFAQGGQTATYVLELGPGSAAAGVAALTAYLVANPFAGYSYLLPREWDAEPTLLGLIAAYENPTARLYFFVTTTTNTYARYTTLMKNVVAFVEAPGIPATEFVAAAGMYVFSTYLPSTLDRVTPYRYSFLYGVTPYPQAGNSLLLTTLETAGVNYVGTGAEGGISTALIRPGTTMDLNDATYWYSVDWVELNLDRDIANAIINGSNNPQAPLYYDQNGINQLRAVAQGTLNRAVAYGLAQGPVTATAVGFIAYVAQNQSDFKTGIYRGLGATYTPNRGFASVTFNINVTQFPTGS